MCDSEALELGPQLGGSRSIGLPRFQFCLFSSVQEACQVVNLMSRAPAKEVPMGFGQRGHPPDSVLRDLPP